ncbi:MAG: hypothetical protein ABH882_00745 [Candidatus Omnitrophota bacterium]|nr:hypothetical protein [Candidatus Omnitrophota bacterium]MBU1928902.1 hypothetical protein [Candidatus Omnitrophota bacterium]MBU2034512.1 hypothetical protein [Candidatus Omnitrophota bacterium]MBU2258590.1 hypothetical protein [Candidatus Omnitrophota bacterium]
MFEKMNERMKKLNCMDIGMVKWSAFLFGIIVAKIFPQLLKIDYIILILLVLILGARPLYRFWFKK